MPVAVTTCWACGGTRVRPDRRFAPDALLACDACGLTFAGETSQEDVAGIYDEAYFEGYAGAGYEQAEQRRHETRLRLTWMGGWAAPPGRLLEVGSAGGYFLEGAAAAGWTVQGIEPEPAQAAAARERTGLTVQATFLHEAELEDGFDVACGWHVLEHIPEPLDALERLRAVLAPGGLLFLEVPNGECTVARVRGARWPLLGLPGHVSQFGPRSLRALLERSGFAPLALDTLAVYRYFRRAEALDPRRIAGRLALSVLSRTPPTGRHPTRHELLRAAARVR